MLGVGFHAVQRAVKDRQVAARRADIYMVRQHVDAIPRLHDRQLGGLAQQLGQHAGVAGMQMRNNHERHPGIGRHAPEQRLERLQPAGRSADANNGESAGFAKLESPRWSFRLNALFHLCRFQAFGSYRSGGFSFARPRSRFGLSRRGFAFFHFFYLDCTFSSFGHWHSVRSRFAVVSRPVEANRA